MTLALRISVFQPAATTSLKVPQMDRGSDLPIPQEIVDYIVDFIEDAPSFRASRLACSVLYLSSKRHLSSNVKLCLPLSVNSATGELRSLAGRTIHKFHELLQVSPRLTSFYTSLDIYIGRPSSDALEEGPELRKEFEILFTILKSLHRLDRLTVSGGTHGRLYSNRVPGLSAMMEKFLQHAHKLTEFTLDGVDGLQITGATLSKWVSLRKLSIICSGDGAFTDPPEADKYSLSFPNLVSLVLAGSDVYQAVRSLLQDSDLPFNLPNLEHLGLVINYPTERSIADAIMNIVAPKLQSLTIDVTLQEIVEMFDFSAFTSLKRLHFISDTPGESAFVPISRFPESLETLDLEIIIVGDSTPPEWTKLDQLIAELPHLHRVAIHLHERYEECDQYECLCSSTVRESLLNSAKSEMLSTRNRNCLDISSKKRRTVWGGLPIVVA